MIRNAKNNYISTLLHENGGTPNAMWKTLKLISSTRKESLTKLEVDGEDVTDSQEIAQHFNDYFVNSVHTMFNPLNFDICGNNFETSTSERDNDENLINDITTVIFLIITTHTIFRLKLLTLLLTKSTVFRLKSYWARRRLHKTVKNCLQCPKCD